jgi:regulator of replication initiation timing
MKRLVDPVHFFDERGASVLTLEHLEAENARLTLENEVLRGKLQNLYAKIKAARAAKAAKS